MTGEIMRQGPHPVGRHTVSTTWSRPGGGQTTISADPRSAQACGQAAPRQVQVSRPRLPPVRRAEGPGSRTRRPEVHQHRHRRLQYLRLERGVRHGAGCAGGGRGGAMGGQHRRGTGGGCALLAIQDFPPQRHTSAPAHSQPPPAAAPHTRRLLRLQPRRRTCGRAGCCHLQARTPARRPPSRGGSTHTGATRPARRRAACGQRGRAAAVCRAHSFPGGFGCA